MNRDKTTHLLMAREQRSRREVEMMQNASLEKRGIDENLTQELRGLNVGVHEGDAFVLFGTKGCHASEITVAS